MTPKTTRAFRTISEAGEELDLQPHVLRFWESKFPEIKPIKRGGGRRFYRPEDIEFLRGIKILLHDEKHPIKDVQKLIRIKGPGRVIELGRSIEKAANPKAVKDTVLVPERILNAVSDNNDVDVEDDDDFGHIAFGEQSLESQSRPRDEIEASEMPDGDDELVEADDASEDGFEDNYIDVEKLEDALETLNELRTRWQRFRNL